MCLVRASWIGLSERRIVLRLSHHITGALRSLICGSFSNDKIQVISAVTRSKHLYSAPVLDQDTMCCFLDCHDIRFDPRRTQNPEVDLLSSGSEAQSSSQKASRCKDDVEFGLSPMSRVPAKYRSILFTACQCVIKGFCIN